jgi:Flp pilus assembly protein TadD
MSHKSQTSRQKPVEEVLSGRHATPAASSDQQQQQQKQHLASLNPFLNSRIITMPKLASTNRKKIKERSRDAAPVTPKQKHKGSKSQGNSQQQLTAAQLFERAQRAIAFERYEVALELLKDAIDIEPENLEIIDARGALLAELGREEEAVQVCMPCWWLARGMHTDALIAWVTLPA